MKDGEFDYAMSILKSNNGNGCMHVTDTHFHMRHPLAGEGRFIHTYMGDGSSTPKLRGRT